MNRILIKLTYLAICGFIAANMFFSTAWGAELYIPGTEAKSGESVKIPVMLDQADNLAGVKLIIKYDATLLKFKKADKTKQTASLMHIINNKNPGVLVVVMAGARGIKGKNFPILSLKFDVKQGIQSKKSASLEIKEAQLMSDQLKDIACNIKVSPLVISADTQKVETAKPKVATEKPASAVISEKKNKNFGECTLEQVMTIQN